MTDYISVPHRTSNGQRNQRYSRHRLSTTPPRVNDDYFVTEEEFVSDEESEEEYLNDSTVQLLFNKIYVDPLQDEFEMLDGEAGTILRTGKFSVTGETGSKFGLAKPVSTRIITCTIAYCRHEPVAATDFQSSSNRRRLGLASTPVDAKPLLQSQ